jgi:hypothetical protein
MLSHDAGFKLYHNEPNSLACNSGKIQIVETHTTNATRISRSHQSVCIGGEHWFWRLKLLRDLVSLQISGGVVAIGILYVCNVGSDTICAAPCATEIQKRHTVELLQEAHAMSRILACSF